MQSNWDDQSRRCTYAFHKLHGTCQRVGIDSNESNILSKDVSLPNTTSRRRRSWAWTVQIFWPSIQKPPASVITIIIIITAAAATTTTTTITTTTILIIISSSYYYFYYYHYYYHYIFIRHHYLIDDLRALNNCEWGTCSRSSTQ